MVRSHTKNYTIGRCLALKYFMIAYTYTPNAYSS